MKKVLLLIAILFVSISAVSASENITDFGVSDLDNLTVQDDADSVAVENDNVADEVGNSDSSSLETLSSNNVIVQDSSKNKIDIRGENLVRYYKSNPAYHFKILDGKGSGISAKDVKITINGKAHKVSTDQNGAGSFVIKNLKPGKYTISVSYNGTSIKNAVNLFASKVSMNKNIHSVYGSKVKYNIKLVDNSKKPVYNAKVTFKIGKKTYKRYTNHKGIATLKLNYNSGKYVIKYFTQGLSGKNKYVVKNKITFKILHWGLKGYVAKASLIKKNIPNNRWVKKAVKATKKGLPLLTIKGGNGKTVFMTSGVHGNELNSQVAVMKMIKYLTTHPIKGTVYIVPFVNVKAISKGVRLTKYDFNRVAHKKGTVSNKIINLVLKLKCDAYGDFHTTVSPGVPGINVVLGYTSPHKCVPLTNYIAKHSKVKKIFYRPGQKYVWSLADYVNHKGTPAVICEVISPVNHVSARATSLSYKQVTSFLNYHSII